jgi:hypothetical protein
MLHSSSAPGEQARWPRANGARARAARRIGVAMRRARGAARGYAWHRARSGDGRYRNRLIEESSMTIINKLSVRLLAITSFAALVAGAAPAHADICKNVDLAVQNNKVNKILALSMDYIFENDNQWHHEAFDDVEVASGAFKTVAWNQNLSGGEGNRLKGLVLYFQAWCGGKWSIEYASVEDTTFDNTSTCQSNSGRSYRLDLNSSDVCNLP